MYLLLALFLLLFELAPEGLALKGSKRIAGFIEFVYRAVVTVIAFSWLAGMVPIFNDLESSFLYKLGGFVLLRFAVADGIHNLCAEEPFFFIGTTKLYDQAWQWFFRITRFPPQHFLAMTKFIAICIGVTWLLKS